MIRYFRGPADRAEIDRIVLADLLLPVLRHHLAVLLVVLPAGEIAMIEMTADALLFRCPLKHPKSFRNYFLAAPIPRNAVDTVFLTFVAHREFAKVSTPPITA